MSLDEAQKQVGSFWSYLEDSDKDWIKNSLGQIISKENIDSYIKELDLNSAKNKLKGILDFDADVKNGDKIWQNYFDTLKDGEGYIVDLIKNTDDLSKLTGEDLVKVNQAARDAVIAHNAALEQQTFCAKAGQVALKGLAIAGNMIAFALISKGLELVVEGLDNWVHRAEKSKKASDELFSTLESAQSALSSQGELIERVNENSEKYSNGVDSLGRNISLTEEEFEDYHDICNKIAEYYPNMVTAWTKEGDAVVDLKDKVNDLKGAYEEEKISALNAFVSGTDDVVDSYNSNADHSSGIGVDVTSGYKQQIAALEAYLDIMQNVDISEQAKAIDDLLRHGGEGFSKFDLQNTLRGLDLAEYSLDEIPSYLSGVIKNLQTQLSTQNDSMKQMLINMFALDSNDYADISDEAYQLGTAFINSLDSSFFDGKSAGEYRSFIDNLLEEINGENTKEVSNAINSLLNMDEEKLTLTSEEYKHYLQDLIKNLQTYLDMDENEIKLMIGMETDEEPETYTDRLINSVKSKVNKTPTAGISFVLSGMFDNDFNKALDKISIGDLEILNNIDDNVFKKFKDLLIDDTDVNSVDEYVTAIEKYVEELKEVQNNIDTDKTDISFVGFNEEQSKSIDDFQSKIKTLSDTLASVRSGETINFTDLIKEFPELEGQSDNLEQSIQQLIYDSLQELYNTLGKGLPKDVKNDLQTIADEASGVAPSLDDAFSAIQNSYDVLHEFKDAMGSDSLTDSILSSAGSLSTELNDMVAGFHSGTVSADQLYEALTDHYNADLQNYGNALIAKSQYSTEFYNAVGLSSSRVIDQFSNNYGVDMENCKSYNSAKLRIEATTLKRISGIWSKYYDAQSMTYKPTLEILRQSAANGNLEAQKEYAKVMKYTTGYTNTMNALNKIVYDGIDSDFDKISNTLNDNSGSNSNDKSQSKTAETFNFIETALTRIESAIDHVKSKAEETFRSFKSRSKAYTETISKITDEINLQEQAKQIYIENRDSVGLDEYWAAQVRDGSLSIAEIGDSALKEQIRTYQEWNDKVSECDKSIEDLKKEQKELVNENIELLITKYEKLAARASNTVQRTQNRIDLKETLGGSANIRNYISMNEGLSRQIGYIRNQNKELKEQQKNVAKCSEAWYEYQEQIDSNTASVQNLTKSMVENARAAASLAGEKADKNVEKYDSKDELYDAKIANAATAKQKNSLIDKKVKNIDKRQEEYDKAVVTSTDNLNSSASEIRHMKSKKTNTSNKTANAQNKKYNAVLKKVKAQISSGRKIGDSLLNQAYQLNDNYELWNACVQYNEYFDAKEKNKTIADLYAETSKQEKADLALEKFNNTSAEYDNKLRLGEQKKTAANNRISLANAQGKQASASDYEELIDVEKDQQKILIKKRDALEQALYDAVNNGSIKEGSDEWYEMLEAIQAVTDEIDESTQSLVEYENALRQLEWDKFDDEMETFQRRNTNRDYQINMLSHKKLVDDETGNFTDEGNATLNLRKSNYQDYLTQAAKYQQEYEKLQKQIAKGELSAEDENVIARLRELEDAHHDAMLSAEEEKESIADLIKEGYQTQLNTLSELIQKYKDLRQSEKDAYEYQKSIAEKTKNIASLQKQLAAYGTNDTEEARAKIQQIKVDLENARQDLKDTEYEKYLSDANDMLDELYNDYESFIDEKLNNTDELLANLDSSINNMSADVVTALNSIHASNEILLQALGSSDIPPTLSRDSGEASRISVSSPITDNFGRGLISESAGSVNPVNISIGDIILQDVQNPEQFSRQLIEIIADDSKVQRTIQAVSVDRLANGSTLSVKRFK